jgi:uncharacterized membrane protein YbhN (UPF0104 family)
MISKLKSRPWVWMGVRVLLSTLVVGMLLHYVPLGQLWAALGQLPPALWFAVLGAYLLAQTVGMLKWRMMVNLAGADLSYVQAARCYFGGMFSTLFLPSVVGGDVVRLSLALRNARSVTGAALASLLDRLIDFAALALLAGAGVILLDGAISPTSKHVLWSVAGVVLLAAIAGLAAIAFLPARRFPLRVRRLIVQLRKSWKAVLAQPRYVALALLLGVVVQGSFVLLSKFVADFCGLHVPMQGWLLAWPLAKLSALVPLTQGGIGVREVALVALLTPFGAQPVLTIAVGFVWETIIVGSSLVAGLLSFILRRVRTVDDAPRGPRLRRPLTPRAGMVLREGHD